MDTRIGLLIASANTTMEYEFQMLAPKGMSIHATRLEHRRLSFETLAAARADALSGAKLLAHADVDCIVYGITAAGFMLGENHDHQLASEITAATGIRTITVLQAVLAKLEALGVKRIALGTPYPADVTEREVRFFSETGYSVTGFAHLGHVDVAEIGRLDSATAVKVAHEAVNQRAQALFLSCTNWHTLPVIAQLKEALSIPVFSSNTAGFALATNALGSQETYK